MKMIINGELNDIEIFSSTKNINKQWNTGNLRIYFER